MAVFSKDQITGKVIINARAEENNTIVNYASNTEDTIQSCYASNFKIDSGISKINKYSIKAQDFRILTKNMETLFKSDKDFTWCFWAYPTNCNDNFCIHLENNRKTDNTFGTIHFIENNNGNKWSGTNAEIVLVRDTGMDVRKNIGTATFDSWRHYAITKKGNIIYFFKDGKIVYSTIISDDRKSTYFDNDGDTWFRVFYEYSIGYFYLDDFVFISGQCLWASDYNIPTDPILGYEGKHQQIYPAILDISNKNNKVFLNYY